MSTELGSASAQPKLQLETLLPDSCAMSWCKFAICVFSCALFLLLCYLPVSDPGTWQLVNQAQTYSCEARSELLPYSQGMRFASIGQPGKQFLLTLFQAGGPEYLGIGFAVSQMLVFCFWVLVFYRIFPSEWSLLAGCGAAMASFFELQGIHTQIFGQFFGAALVLVLLSARGDTQQWNWNSATRFQWAAVFVVMVLWTNFDATFILGLGGLFVFAFSRILEVSSWKLIFKDKEFRCRIWLFEFALLATLFTSQGIGLWKTLLWWPDNPILQSLKSPYPALLAGWTTGILAIAWAVWFVVSRKVKQLEFPTLILAMVASLLVILSHKLIFWFAVAISLSILELATRVPMQRSPSRETHTRPGAFKFTFTLLSALAIWMAFCFSPIGAIAMGGADRTQQEIIGQAMPYQAKEYLRSDPAILMHCPVYWSDWLQSETGQPTMLTNSLHLTPRFVGIDFHRIFEGDADWRKVADKYSITCLLIDKDKQSRLNRSLRRRPAEWKKAHEDSLCVIYRREL